MATSLAVLIPDTNNPTTKALEDEAKPAMEFVKSNKGRKQTGKGPHQKKQPQRGMGVEKLERLRIQERWKKMTETTATTTTQFPTDPIGTSNVPVLHGVANYGVPMMINGGSGGLWGWDDTAGLVMQRVVGNGGFGGLNSQVLVGVPGDVQVACGAGVVEDSKELSSMPKLQHCKPDRCDVCFKKMRCNGDNVRFNGGFNQFGQVLPKKGAGFLGWNLENDQNINEEMNAFSARAARSASAYAGHMNNINETVDVVAIHRKGNSIGTGSVLMEYEFFPGKSNRNTSTKERKLPAEASAAVGGEASYANASNCVDLSLKLSY
ncbi:protein SPOROCYTELESS [Durio zibethinus]|uniref:Protein SPOROCYTELESS n=1 Tax=Durio zibethinus TaxID=66656 RepID=A0A6P5ZMC0_DURZI|nr:protein SPOROCYTELESS [Durio zibethinus]